MQARLTLEEIIGAAYWFVETPLAYRCKCEVLRQMIWAYCGQLDIPYASGSLNPDCQRCQAVSRALVNYLTPGDLEYLESECALENPVAMAILDMASHPVGVSLQ
jgi:hypothetical protein